MLILEQTEIDYSDVLKRVERIEDRTLERFEYLSEELMVVREVLNNGIVSATEGNTQAIKNLEKQIQTLNECVVTEDAKSSGKKEMLKIIIGIVSGIGSGIVTTLTILYQLGVL